MTTGTQPTIQQKKSKEIIIHLDNTEKSLQLFNISDNSQYQNGGEIIKSIKQYKKDLTEERLKATRPLDESKSTIMSWFKPYIKRCETLVTKVTREMIRFRNIEEDKRKKEEARLRKEAEKKEEREKEKLQRQADKAREKGNEEKAQELEEQKDTTHVPPPIVESRATQPQGTAMTVNWKFRIVNDALIPREYLIPNEVRIGQIVRSMKKLTSIPGVEVYPEESIRPTGR